MFEKIKNGLKEVKRLMGKKLDLCKEMIDSRTKRAVVGVVIIGLGIGLGGSLIISAYMPLPA